MGIVMTAGLAAVAVLFLCALGDARPAEARVQVRPKDTGEAPANPGMGWAFHYYDNSLSQYGGRLDPSDTLEDFPGLSVIYLRLAWAYVEPEEGRFSWAVVDSPAQRWVWISNWRRGRRRLCVSSSRGIARRGRAVGGH